MACTPDSVPRSFPGQASRQISTATTSGKARVPCSCVCDVECYRLASSVEQGLRQSYGT